MARSVDEVEFVVLTLVPVDHLDGVALDGDALLLLQIHIVEDLVFHISGSQCAGKLDKPVGKGGLAVVYVRNYAKITDAVHFHIECKDNLFFCYICTSRVDI